MDIIQKMRNERLRQYWEAEQKVLGGQSYTIGNRTLTKCAVKPLPLGMGI